jgi:hypothetical protein
MNHLPYIAASYAVFAVVTLYLSASAATRLRVTTRRLAALDQRKVTT